MKKLLGLMGALIACSGSLAVAQQAMSGYLRVAYGHVRQADGTMKNIAGTWVPYTAVPIETHVITPLGLRKPPSKLARPQPMQRPQPRTITNVYLADSGSNYGVIGDGFGGLGVNPDTLDDMLMLSTGVNKPWKNITFGFQPEDNHPFLMRWIVYETFTPNGGPDSFSHVPSASSDFGVVWPGSAAGTSYKVTIDISAAGAYCDQSQIYLAEEFRDTSDLVTGNGPLDPTVHTVFNAGGPVSIGSSNNGFWWDWNPMDGVFVDPDEFDVFDTNDPPASYGNLLFGISVDTSGVTNNIQPFPVNLDIGNLVSGNFTDVWQIDQSYYVTSQAFNVSRSSPTIQIEMDGQAASTSAISYHFSLTAAGNQSGNLVKVYFFNYSTSAWDLRSTFTLTNVDTTYDVNATTTPTNYISSTKQMKTRIALFNNPIGSRGFQFKIDKGGWIITH